MGSASAGGRRCAEGGSAAAADIQDAGATGAEADALRRRPGMGAGVVDVVEGVVEGEVELAVVLLLR